MQGVYKITNLVDGKFYIGSSKNIEGRWYTHKKELNSGYHNNQHLQRAWNKYGKENFKFEVLEEVADLDKIRERENYYIKSTNCCDHSIGYNMLDDATIGIGVSHSLEVRQKISEACKGEKNGHYGRKHSPETIKAMRDKRWGENYVCKKKLKGKELYAHQEELRIKKTNKMRLSKEELSKLRSERMKNRVVSQETREKLRQNRLGKKLSDETRRKMREQRSGEKNGNSKLTKAQVLEIYHKMNNGVNYKDVCSEYGIGQCQAYKIKRKEHWVFNDTTNEIL